VSTALVGTEKRTVKGIGAGSCGRLSKAAGEGDSVPWLVGGLPRERLGDEAGAVLGVNGVRLTAGFGKV